MRKRARSSTRSGSSPSAAVQRARAGTSTSRMVPFTVMRPRRRRRVQRPGRRRSAPSTARSSKVARGCSSSARKGAARNIASQPPRSVVIDARSTWTAPRAVWSSVGSISRRAFTEEKRPSAADSTCGPWQTKRTAVPSSICQAVRWASAEPAVAARARVRAANAARRSMGIVLSLGADAALAGGRCKAGARGAGAPGGGSDAPLARLERRRAALASEVRSAFRFPPSVLSQASAVHAASRRSRAVVPMPVPGGSKRCERLPRAGTVPVPVRARTRR